MTASTITPQALVDQLIQTYLNTDPADTQAKTALAGFALALGCLAEYDSTRAEEVVDWWTQDGGPTLEDFETWAHLELASSPARYEGWEADARKATTSQAA